MSQRFPSSPIDPRPIPGPLVPLSQLECATQRSKGLLILESADDSPELAAAGANYLNQLECHLPPPKTPGERRAVLSSTARQFQDPDLFVRLRAAPAVSESGTASPCDIRTGPESCLPDLIVSWDGKDFEPDVKSIGWLHGQWVVERPATVVLLAGGLSSRLGINKALLPMRSGKTLIECVVQQMTPMFSQILISTNTPELLAFLGLPMIPDDEAGQGPLMGMTTALRHSTNDLNLVVSCDAPYIDPHAVTFLFRHIQQHDACVLVTPDGRYHNLFALYRKSVIGPATRSMASGRRRMPSIIDFGADIRYVQAPEGLSLLNLNTPEDVENWYQNQGGKEFC